MELSILGKIFLILKYFTSSFLGIELFLIVLFLFIFLMLNIKRKNIIVKYAVPIVLVLILFFISGGFHEFVKISIDSFIKYIMNYYYFPNMAVYYITIVVITIIFIYTILNEKMDKIKKIINYISFSRIFLMFIGLTSFFIKNDIALEMNNNIYANDIVLAFVQITNFIVLIWLLITFFYYLYKYFKKKCD